jgi:hypothetical protein
LASYSRSKGEDRIVKLAAVLQGTAITFHSEFIIDTLQQGTSL